MRPRVVELLNDLSGTGLFGWIVPSAPVLYVAAMTACMLLFARRSRSAGLSTYHALGAALWAMAAGLVGARVLYLLPRIALVAAEPSILFQLDGGTVSWGAYLGGAAGLFGYVLAYDRGRALLYADAAASCIGLGAMIGRFACFLDGDDFGTPSSVPWAVTYPEGSHPFVAHVEAGWLDPAASASSLPVHPVQLYLALTGVLLFVLSSWARPRVSLRPGTLFLLFWAADGFSRFALEFFRGDPGRWMVMGMPDGQVIALVVCILASAAAGWRLRPARQRFEAGLSWSCRG
jgi:phosphatidylglycerol:prolipoprotein diacylglycerol transferase